MDVRCENCGTEYEFDDAKLTEAGITVKCTQCGYLFRVSKRSAANELVPSPNYARPGAAQWRIRTRSNEIYEFQELSTLQEWILQGKVSRQDELSRSGENWKTLGSISELAGLFRSAAESTQGSLSRPVMTSAYGDAPFSAAPPPPPPNQGVPVVPTPPFQASMSMTDLPAQSVAYSAQSANLDFPGMQPPKQGGGARNFFLGMLVCAILAGGGFTAYTLMTGHGKAVPTVTPPPTDSRFDAKIAAAEADWLRDTIGGFKSAQAAYREALDLTIGRKPEELGLVQLGLARSAICEAEYAKLEGQANDQALAAASAALGEARKSLGSNHAQLLLIEADLHRVKGDVAASSKSLDAAEEAGAIAKDVALVRAAIDLHSASPDLQALATRLKSLSMAAQKRPRAQFLMAWALDKAGKQAEAREITKSLISRNPDHGPGNRLLARLSVEPAVKADVAANTKPAQEAQAPAQPQQPAKVAEAKPAAEKPADNKPRAPKESTAADTSGGYDSLLSRGYSLMKSGKTDQARALFEAAASKKPSSPEPLANLGWCALDGGNSAQAVSYFKKALDKNPRYADAMFGLGESLERSGNKAEAVKAYNAYLQTHPNGQHAAMVTRKLARLQ